MLRGLRERAAEQSQKYALPKCPDGSLEEGGPLEFGRPSIGCRNLTAPYSPGSSLLLMGLFIVALIICRKQIFVCAIHKNLSPTKFFFVAGKYTNIP